MKSPKSILKSTKSELFEPPMQANTLVLHPGGLGFFPYLFCIDVQLLSRSVVPDLQYD